MLTPEEAAKRLIALADRARNLSVRRRSPEAFFEERSELDSDMRALAGEIYSKPARVAAPADRSSFKPGAIAHRGRIVAVQTRGAGKRTPTRSLAEKVFAA